MRLYKIAEALTGQTFRTGQTGGGEAESCAKFFDPTSVRLRRTSVRQAKDATKILKEAFATTESYLEFEAEDALLTFFESRKAIKLLKSLGSMTCEKLSGISDN